MRYGQLGTLVHYTLQNFAPHCYLMALMFETYIKGDWTAIVFISLTSPLCPCPKAVPPNLRHPELSQVIIFKQLSPSPYRMEHLQM